MTITTDLSRFGQIELQEAINILQALKDNGIPDDFNPVEVQLMFNQNSGFVFLTNNNYETAMVDSSTNTLHTFWQCNDCGQEGTQDELDLDENYVCAKCNGQPTFSLING